MKGSKLLKKAAAAFFAASLCMSFAAVANAANKDNPNVSYVNETEYGDTIQFSAYKISQETENRVKNPSWSVTGYKTIDLLTESSSDWTPGLLRSHNNGAYNGGRYLCYQLDTRDPNYPKVTNTVTFKDVPYGTYKIYQFDTNQSAGESVGMTITVSSEAGSNEYTFTPTLSGDFVELGEVKISGDVTFTYKMTELKNHLRIDETKLVKQTPEAIEQKADLVEDINDNGDGASVWKATVDFDGEYSYTKLGVSAKLRETGEEKDGTAVNMPTISGKSSVYAVIAVNKLSDELDWVKVTVE